ncbi:MAG: hypothetical protein IJW92_03865, partial [Clostridia bacterium]|nr:hypothetical protein [Clostridia bacterium]
MTSKDIYRCLGGLDPLLIEKAAPQERVQKKNVILRWAALAACLALVASAVLGIPLLMKEGQDPPEGLASGEISSESAGGEGSTAETIDDGTKLTGKQELSWGTSLSKDDWKFSRYYGIHFGIQTVVEAEVVEILPDSYSLVGGVREYHVIKLRI